MVKRERIKLKLYTKDKLLLQSEFMKKIFLISKWKEICGAKSPTGSSMEWITQNTKYEKRKGTAKCRPMHLGFAAIPIFYSFQIQVEAMSKESLNFYRFGQR